MVNTRAIEKKWCRRWSQEKIFEAEPCQGKKKFFGTFPYPYVNSYLHLGHFYSSMKLEAISRFKRMKGFNVLYPQAWHCTGSPIVNAARRVKEAEPTQIEILRKQGFSDKEIAAFADPEKWVEYFPKEAKKDFEKMGYSIDFRREFITTSLNPHYDAFIRWQFRRLYKMGRVIKGRFPVVWDPVENNPVGDHARLEGEGETPQEYLLLKHQLKDGRYLVTATLRPDTVLGITNLYINPESVFVEAKVDGESWIVSERTAKELSYQDKDVEIIKEIFAKDLLGKKVREFSGRDVPVLPGAFVDQSVGTGLVHSVPSDSTDDLVALYDLQNDEKTIKKYALDPEEVKKIKPIPLLIIPGYGEIPAADLIKAFNIRHQGEREKLRKAKEKLYKDGFYKGILNKLYANHFSEDFSLRSVREVKDQILEEIKKSPLGDVYYQLTGKVVARSLGECVVKIVDDQWFLAYGDKKWKKEAHKCLDSMELYPEKARPQFNYVLDWLRNWACTRELGLGSRLPWDEKWLIESLSDSTIYMAYYTISHKIQDIEPKKLNDAFFDFVFLGKKGKLKISQQLADELREEFLYWYPMDFRTTGKDLIQNHMSFCVFNHTAIFPRKFWPKGFGINGHVMVDGEKMSKSKGNFILMREMHEQFGADASRFTVLYAGDGLDDANVDTELARSMQEKINQLCLFAKEYYDRGTEEQMTIDNWMMSHLSLIIRDATRSMEQSLFRSALQRGYFDLQRLARWYLRRRAGRPNKKVMNKLIRTQLLLLAPFMPFICEEIWELIGEQSLISIAPWPEAGDVFEGAILLESLVETTHGDIRSVLTLTHIQHPQKIKLFVAESWKYDLFKELKNTLLKTRDFSAIMEELLTKKIFKKHSKTVSVAIRKGLNGRIAGKVTSHENEMKALRDAKEFLTEEFKTNIEIAAEHGAKEPKARQAMPGKPAILVIP